MARLPRLYLEGCAQHVIQRGNNREACFYDEADYKAYLSFLAEAAEKYQVSIHAFVLMTNHVHLLATPSSEQGISRMMQALGRKYVQYFNFSYGRTGTLWEGRYKSTLVDSERYLLTVYQYIELNPVRAGMVQHAAEYTWSSYRHNGVGKRVRLITEHSEYQRLGKTDKIRQQQYRLLFQGKMEERDVTAIRAATNKSWVLGSDRFKVQIEEKTGRCAAPNGRGGDRRSEKFLLGREDQ
jgi:putative transposase